jgi:predicted  nucleic acid-binding Zn-ribbon protein
LERAQLKREAEQVEERLYAGNIHNPRELTDLQDKLAELNRRHAELEEPLLEAMFALEEGEEAVQTAKDKLEQVLAEQAETLGALRDEQAQLTSQHDTLDTDIEKARAAINAPHLSLYDSLLARLRGKAVSQVNGDECGICGVQLTSQLAQKGQAG